MQALAVTRDGQQLATGSPEGPVRVWDIASHRLLASSPWKVRFVNDLAFSPDGKLLAVVELPGAIILWAGLPMALAQFAGSRLGVSGACGGSAGVRGRSLLRVESGGWSGASNG